MKPIYLDYAATSPLRPEVREAMEPFLSDGFGNPASVHRWGRDAGRALEDAREEVGESLGVPPAEVFFVRGGTEGDNLAVLGRIRSRLRAGAPAHLVISSIEHSAVREAAAQAGREGARVDTIPVDARGMPDWEVLEAALESGADLVSVMWVNNETGLVLPIEEVGERCRHYGVPFHTDAVQALGRMAVDLKSFPAELATFSAHKVGGPKSVGVLVAREGVELEPLHFGGGQEGGLRPGTPDVAGAVGAARAVRLAVDEGSSRDHVRRLRDLLEEGLRSRIPDLRIHGGEGPRAPHISNLGFPGVDASTLIVSLDLNGVAVSRGSACASGTEGASPVLRALYGPEALDYAPVRFSLSPATPEEEVREAVTRTVETLERVRAMEVGA